jgi:predicted TIM-barrel fold metal-dependent hydrolase
MEKKPIINCHTHIFTGDHVPPWLARTFLPWPFYYLLPLTGVVKLFRWWYKKGPYAWQFKGRYKKLVKMLYHLNMFIRRTMILRLLKGLAGILVTVHVFFILYDWLSLLIAPDAAKGTGKVEQARTWLQDHYILFPPGNIFYQLLLVLVLLLFFKSGRNLIFFLLKRFWKFLGMLPGKQTTDLAKRYLNIGRFSFYEGQGGIFGRLRNQYPEGTRLVVLPMDMEYMGAGAVKTGYRTQMEELAELKDRHKEMIYPFVFADPRRMAAEPDYFKYHIGEGGKVILEDCFIKEYIEQHGFSGFKIYPALGYYVFDERLLPLWRYAADNGIPVLTHCIRGTIYYRGKKEKDWDKHPVFEQAMGNDKYEPLLLPEMKNIDFSVNFTHPLNYLCLLDEVLLRKLVKEAKDNRTRDLFGYINEAVPLQYNLHHLKLCLGHFGGDDEWKRFFERDRDNLASQLVRNPQKGIDFFPVENGERKRGKLEQVWRDADWYTIICSLMLQYPHVYGDISYIVHSEEIIPLLKHTLIPEHARLRQRVLFGTDFYVVRNHKSDKNMLADILSHLSEEEFDLIARENPEQFLSRESPVGSR